MKRTLALLLSTGLGGAPVHASIPKEPTPLSEAVHTQDELNTLNRSLMLTRMDLEYQASEVLVPLLDYGTLNPKYVKTTLLCGKTCTVSFAFNHAARDIPGIMAGVDDYENSRQNYQDILDQLAKLRADRRAENHPLPDEHFDQAPYSFPRLDPFVETVVISVTGASLDCTNQVAPNMPTYRLSGGISITFVFPPCINPPEEIGVAGYEVRGNNIIGLGNEPRPDGIELIFYH